MQLFLQEQKLVVLKGESVGHRTAFAAGPLVLKHDLVVLARDVSEHKILFVVYKHCYVDVFGNGREDLVALGKSDIRHGVFLNHGLVERHVSAPCRIVALVVGDSRPTAVNVRSVGVLRVVVVNRLLEFISATGLVSGIAIEGHVLVDNSAAQRSAAGGKEGELKEGNDSGEEIVGILNSRVHLVGAWHDIEGVILADRQLVGALTLADPEVIVNLVDAGRGVVVVDVKLVDAASLLYLVVDGGKKILKLGVVSAAGNVGALYVSAAVEEGAVGSVVVINTVEIVSVKCFKGLGKNEIAPLLTAGRANAVLEVSSGSAIKLSYGKLLLEIGVEFVEKSRGNVGDYLDAEIVAELDEIIKTLGVEAGIFVSAKSTDMVVPILVELNKLNTVFCHALDHVVVVFCGLNREGGRVVTEVVDCLRRQIFADSVTADIGLVAKLRAFDVFYARSVLFECKKFHMLSFRPQCGISLIAFK